MIKIILPDQSIKTFTSRPTVLDVAQALGPRLAKDTLGGLVSQQDEEKLLDLRDLLSDGDHLTILTDKHTRSSAIYLHSAAHILAQATQELFPDVQITIGPVIKDGFYYDFYTPKPFTTDDLPKIEKKMHDIIQKDLLITKEIMSIQEAIAFFKGIGEDFKVEIIQDLEAQEGIKEVSIYRQGDWLDLCRGPHIQRTGQLKAFKLLSVAAAYFRGDEKRQPLQRIYGTAWPTAQQLKNYLQKREDAQKRDHRKLGKQIGLFYFHPLAPGSPFFTPKGCVIYKQLVEYIQQLYKKYDYQEVITPEIFNIELYKTSGHYEHFLENMFFAKNKTKEDILNHAVKPMNCPGHCLLFQMQQHSYRDLPLRIADFGRLHRWERSGVLNGLLRVRTMCQDDAHIFCTEDQIKSEVTLFIHFLNEVYKVLGLNQKMIVRLATRPTERAGSDMLWDRSEIDLEGALKDMNLSYEKAIGEGAFYGPKVEFHITDALDRSWQLGTIQLDYVMPERFGLKYTGPDNHPHTPVMLHRAILGTFERFIGVYLEHLAGQMPPWLAPCQVRILNITDQQDGYCQRLVTEFKEAGVRVEYDSRSEKLGYKMRDAHLNKIPYIVIIGQKEMENTQVSIRSYGGIQKNAINKDDFLSKVVDDIRSKSLNPFLLEKSKMK